MKNIIFISVMMLLVSGQFFAQESKQKSKYRHKGLKISAGLGELENNFEKFSEKLTGEGGMLSLGWGISNRSTLWLTVLAASRKDAETRSEKDGFAALELNWQYRFRPESAFQPYVKLGGGLYFIDRKSAVFSGGGLAGAIGADLFLSSHIAVGAELQIKGQNYSRRSETINGVELTTKVDPGLQGESTGFMFTLTLQ